MPPASAFNRLEPGVQNAFMNIRKHLSIFVSSGLVTLFPCILEAMTFRNGVEKKSLKNASLISHLQKGGIWRSKAPPLHSDSSHSQPQDASTAPESTPVLHNQSTRSSKAQQPRHILASGASERRPSTRAFPFRLGMVKLPATPALQSCALRSRCNDLECKGNISFQLYVVSKSSVPKWLSIAFITGQQI